MNKTLKVLGITGVLALTAFLGATSGKTAFLKFLPITVESSGQLIREDFGSIVKTSDLVVQGTIDKKDIITKGKPTDNDFETYTIYTVKVDESYKNPDNFKTIKVKAIGGKVDNITIENDDLQDMNEGESYILCLYKWPDETDLYGIRGSLQGQYKLEDGQAKNKRNEMDKPEKDLKDEIQKNLK